MIQICSICGWRFFYKCLLGLGATVFYKKGWMDGSFLYQWKFFFSYFVATFMAFYVHLNIIRNKYKMMKKILHMPFVELCAWMRGAIRIYLNIYVYG